MALSSVLFMWTFLPASVILAAFVRRTRVSNILLLILSLLFYAWGDPGHILLLICVTAADYALGLLLGKHRTRGVLALSVVFNLGVLGVFKYADLLLSTLDRFVPGDLPRTGGTLPLGISFFTFSALTYLIDLYRGRYPAEKNPLNMALYLSFFPRILSGPIETYEHFRPQMENRRMTVDGFAAGLRRFLYGLGKKVLIADLCGITVGRIFNLPEQSLSGAGAWIGMILYMLQLYYDFSGYSDMAVGIGRMFGFTLPENFDYPYLSRTVGEFWRRWHITLGAWFREYLYIPLGGSRKGMWRTVRNLFIVFALTGLWHGADWTFVLWGLYQGVFVVLERTLPVGKKQQDGKRRTLGEALTSSRVIGPIWAPLLWCISLVLFRSSTFAEAADIYRCMFVPSLWRNAGTFLPQMFTLQTLLAAVFGILGCGPLAAVSRTCRPVGKAAARFKNSAAEAVYLAFVFFLSVLVLAGGTYQAFIYQRF